MAKCTGFHNCRFLNEFLLLLTHSSLAIEFNTSICDDGFLLEPSLDHSNENQDRLYFINQMNARNPARINCCCGFPTVLENIRPDVFNTSSLVIDCETEDAKAKKYISVVAIFANAF